MRFERITRALILPHSYSAGPSDPHSRAPETIGDYTRKRLALKMLQREVADQIGVDKASIFNWEASTSQPDFRYMPAIVDFLGYDPLPAATTLAEQMVRRRTSLGVSQKEAARSLGVDPTTLARWERGEREPTGGSLKRVGRIIDDAETASSSARRAG